VQLVVSQLVAQPVARRQATLTDGAAHAQSPLLWANGTLNGPRHVPHALPSAVTAALHVSEPGSVAQAATSESSWASEQTPCAVGATGVVVPGGHVP